MPRSRLEWTLEILSAIGLAFPFAIIAYFWADLPATIPLHFDSSGTPNSWGSKMTIFIVPIVSLPSYLILSVLGPNLQNMDYINLPKGVDKSNPKVIQLTRELLSWMKTVTALLFSYIVWMQIQVALGKESWLNLITTALFLLATFVIVFFYLRKMRGV